MTTNPPPPKATKIFKITERYLEQRIDNFLFSQFKNIPKQRIYKGIRKGEVRINGKRAQPLYKLQLNDMVRLPPFLNEDKGEKKPTSTALLPFLKSNIIYEDPHLIILNKPSGLAVHGGSGIKTSIIETFKQATCPEIELVHRLDRETSGCLLIAKKRSILKELHEMLAEHKIKKTYLALLKGRLTKPEYSINLPLTKKENTTHRTIKVSPEGKSASTIFRPLHQFKNCTLVEIDLHTGRMHQIRVHASAIGHPVAGDEKYGSKSFNQEMKNLGLKRLFLHAAALEFKLSKSDSKIHLCACLDKNLLILLKKLGRS